MYTNKNSDIAGTIHFSINPFKTILMRFGHDNKEK